MYEVNEMEIHDRIKARRKELGLSAETVAEKLGVSPATIYRYENNDIKKFPTEILEPLAKVLHTTSTKKDGFFSRPLFLPVSIFGLVKPNFRLCKK